ncbi:uncharacterized protein E0L32_006257 [Thyridium curvatum]|uniref:Uncharacterized protein n=1 Tax=Thyridium curvatum TaxID=1093900 RepID=A0A507B3H6_9PEZI|nr:uncharacterized protein E0L32_006257 [Thyridium curvatum]TPX13284.1 hypothetical protein E0L32_006257 [Thyridium curvatum]
MNSQFALSLELTRLIPLIFNTGPGKYVMKLARDLQLSGSDLITEEDLASKVGRCRIDGQIASSFRSLVSKSAYSRLCEGIVLEAGAGPTISRALVTGQNAYFATVVQLSMLVACFTKEALAVAIYEMFEIELEEAPEGSSIRAMPSEQAIAGVLRACEDQTTQYDWTLVLLAVAYRLGLPQNVLTRHLPGSIFRGLVYMLPLVQQLPDDRMILVEIEDRLGICPIIVWAHHICSLNVAVRVYRSGSNASGQVIFGSEPVQMVIAVRSSSDDWYSHAVVPSITLLKSSSAEEKEALITLVPDPDESKLEAVHRIGAEGYGKAVLQDAALQVKEGADAIAEDIMFISYALAILIAGHLVIRPEFGDRTASGSAATEGKVQATGNSQENEKLTGEAETDSTTLAPYHIPTHRIHDAADLLFSRKRPPMGVVEDYVTFFRTRGTGIVGAPHRIDAILKRPSNASPNDQGHWWRLLPLARYLAVLLLAFANISESSSCREIPLSFDCAMLRHHPLIWELQEWDGKSDIAIGEFTWFRAIGILLTNQTLPENGPFPSLLSDCGWSIFLSTLDQQSQALPRAQMKDPMTVYPGLVFLRQGVPSRNGVRKHAISDAPSTQGPTPATYSSTIERMEQATLRCFGSFKLGLPLYGEQQQSFIVTLRLNREAINFRDFIPDTNISIQRTGFSELFSAIWTVLRTNPCQGHNALTASKTIELPPGYATVADWNEELAEPEERARVLITLTAGNSTARWRTLVSIVRARRRLHSDHHNSDDFPGVLLRGDDCCFQCAIDQTAMLTGRWRLVL